MSNTSRILFTLITLFIFSGCASYKIQYKNSNSGAGFPEKETAHNFYFIGDAGNAPAGNTTKALEAFKTALEGAGKNSTAIFLGDNIYPNGMPKKDASGNGPATHRLDMQTDAVKGFKGNTVFIPGNHDWYSGLKGLKRQEKYIENELGKNTFLPEDGCPMESKKIGDDIVLIIIDSQWYLANWDAHPGMNDDCEIKTRNKFFDEFKSLIKKSRGKTTIIALHHPLFSNGPHGGQYSLGQHLKPLPVLGTLKSMIRKTGGVTVQDMQSARYNEFRKRVITLAQENDKVIVVSGHEHSLQYIKKDNIPQIVSGSGSKTSPTRNVDGEFSAGMAGYARLDVFKDGSSGVSYYEATTGNLIFQTEIYSKTETGRETDYASGFPASKTATIYTQEEITKGNTFQKLWGKRYRKYFGTPVNAPTVDLDTLFGGLTPVRKGGGNQSKSLRLEDKQGREYVMRALRKNAVQYLQAVAFKDQYIEGQYNNTYTESLLLDVFTGSHPYAPFTVGTLAGAVNIYHTNPVLYYIPKQNALGAFNTEFGDELYMIEERAASGHGDKKSFGNSNTIISTDDLFKKLRKNNKHYVDQAMYIRARLFDMLIGDWDRHEDQWRWAEFEDQEGNTMYRPVPRDRDQAFSIMGDGALLSVATRIVPGLRLLRSYEEDLRNPKWFNTEPYPLDMALINKAGKQLWDAQVKLIQDNLTDAVIDEAFSFFPKEVQDETIAEIRRKLLGRRRNLQKISDSYYKYISKYAVVKGTDKEDWFEIERMPDGKTGISAFKTKNNKKGKLIYQNIYDKKHTKEIWIYGLDDNDSFMVKGTGNNLIKIRIVGGQNKDHYIVENGKNVILYDHRSKENKVEGRVKTKFTDNYETNVYDHKKLKNSFNQLLPGLGANPDDGLKIGLSNTYTLYGFERAPFTAQHAFSINYYFATSGFELSYNGEFARVIGDLNLGISADYNSPNYAINFFDYGNETINPNTEDQEQFNLDHNRVRIGTFTIAPSLIWHGELGAQWHFGASFETNEVENTEGRFINTVFSAENPVFERQSFLGINADYQYENYDNSSFATLGLSAGLQAGYKINLNNTNTFAYIIPVLGFNHKLIPGGQLVLATKLKGHVILGNGFEFYQAASIGADDGLRGYRNQRFTGKNAFYQNIDLRYNFRKLKTGLLPLQLGIYAGFDYGRVWVSNDSSDTWNTSHGFGFFADAAEMLTARIALFYSDDGSRLSFGVGFGF